MHWECVLPLVGSLIGIGYMCALDVHTLLNFFMARHGNPHGVTWYCRGFHGTSQVLP